MKVNRIGRREEFLRTRRSLRWALVLVVATVGTGWRTARAGINQWTSLGPYGGAIKTLVIDPQNTSTMYAGTWSTQRLPDHFYAQTLVIDPQSPDTVYVVADIGFWAGETFDPTLHGGVLKTTDGGASWMEGAGLDNPSVSDLVIDSGTPNIL